MKLRGQDVYWQSANGNIAVTYNRDGMGDKWAVYRRHYYAQTHDPNEFQPAWEFVRSFNDCIRATAYAEIMYDGNIYR